MARMYGPVFAFAVAAMAVPFVWGAVVNHSLRRRFTLNANLCAFVLAVASVAFRFDAALCAHTLPAFALAALPALVLLAASAAFAGRFRFNVAASLALVAFAAFLPALGNYCLTDVLSAGEAISARYLLCAVAAVAPPVAALLYLGTKLFENAE